MPSDLNIRADIVAAGVGLPRAWRCDTGEWYTEGDAPFVPGDVLLDASDPQTAFGLAMRLDEWERRGCRYWDKYDVLWERHWRYPERMLARVEQVGLDHAIRRALGEEPKPGTLAKFGLMMPHGQWWRWDDRENGGAFVEWDRHGQFIGSAGCSGVPSVPALGGIGPGASYTEGETIRELTASERLEALRAIHAVMSPDTAVHGHPRNS